MYYLKKVGGSLEFVETGSLWGGHPCTGVMAADTPAWIWAPSAPHLPFQGKKRPGREWVGRDSRKPGQHRTTGPRAHGLAQHTVGPPPV